MLRDEVVFILTRKLDTRDRQDFVLRINTEMKIGWACNEETSNTRETATRTGAFKLKITSSD